MKENARIRSTDICYQRSTGVIKTVVQQGRSHFGVRSVLTLRQLDTMATCLREAGPAKAGNAAGDFFQHSHNHECD